MVRSYTELKRHTGEQSSASGTERTIGNARETLYALALSADAKRVAAAGHTGCVYLWDEKGNLLGKLESDGTP